MECSQASSMADFITNWKPYLPGWILRDLVQDSILTRIQKDVDDWDPITNNLSVHLWIRPWISFLGFLLLSRICPCSLHPGLN